jgi:hypothetical protein
MMWKSLVSLAKRRTQITDQIATIDDLRCGSITSTTGDVASRAAFCHQPNQPAHSPNLRPPTRRAARPLRSLPDPAARAQG